MSAPESPDILLRAALPEAVQDQDEVKLPST